MTTSFRVFCSTTNLAGIIQGNHLKSIAMANGTRTSQLAINLISRYTSQTSQRAHLRTCLNSLYKPRATSLHRFQPLPAHTRLFSTSRSFSERTKLEKWLEEQNAKLDGDIKEMEEFNDAFDFAMRSKGYSEGALRMIHGVAWAITVSICAAIVGGVFWGLRKFEIWPFGPKESEIPVVEEKRQHEESWNGKDE